MKLYRASPPGAVAVIDGAHVRALPMRLDLVNHSPTGFAWGYGGSGASQLALALLADAFGDDARALKLYQDFKWALLARLDQDEAWAISDTIVRSAIVPCLEQQAAADFAEADGS